MFVLLSLFILESSGRLKYTVIWWQKITMAFPTDRCPGSSSRWSQGWGMSYRIYWWHKYEGFYGRQSCNGTVDAWYLFAAMNDNVMRYAWWAISRTGIWTGWIGPHPYSSLIWKNIFRLRARYRPDFFKKNQIQARLNKSLRGDRKK